MCTCFFVAVLAAMVIISWRLRNAGAMLVLFMSFLFQCVFSVMVYQLHIWHYISLVFVFLWMLWSMTHTAKEKQVEKDKWYSGSMCGLQIALGVLALAMLFYWNSEEEPSNLQQALHGSYSDGQNAAEFIQNRIGSDEIMISTDVPLDSTILAYLKDYRFYYAGTGKETSYADWSEEQSQTITLEEMLAWCKSTFPMKKEAYLIQGNASCIIDAEKLADYEVIYETEGTTVRGEEYRIYRIPLTNEEAD